MKGNVLLVATIFTLCIALNGFAITLEEALKEAVSQSDELKVAEYAGKMAVAQAKKLTASTLPQISIEGGYGYQGTNQDNPFEPYKSTFPDLYDYAELPDSQSQITVKLDQVLFAGGNIWRTWQLENKMETQAEKAVHLKKNEIRKNVKTAFQKVLLLNSNLKILRDRVAQREEELNDALV